MHNDYSKYILYMLLIAVLIGVFFAAALVMIRKIGSKRDLKNLRPLINCGSIGVFFDRENNVTLIPYVKDKYGVGRATEEVGVLRWPYSAQRLGKAARNCMVSCKNGAPCPDDKLMKLLGAVGWKEFSEGKRNISVYYKEGQGIYFNTTVRTVDGAYHFNQTGNKYVLPGDTDDRELGEMLLGLVRFCRC